MKATHNFLYIQFRKELLDTSSDKFLAPRNYCVFKLLLQLPMQSKLYKLHVICS